MEDGILPLQQADARQVLLVRAIEDVDPQGRLVSDVEREQVEREALEASRHGGTAIDVPRYLNERARRMLAIVDKRQPRIAVLHQPEGWRRWLLFLLPIAACVVGAAIDRIDNPQRVNMLSPPLLGVIAWNLVVYLLLVAGALLPRGLWPLPPAVGLLQRWMTGAPAAGQRTGRLRSDVLGRFQQHWLRAAMPQEALWLRQLLHLSAAGWALGLAFSIILGGIVREYRVGWESTLLDVHQVHAFLAALFAPVVALLPFDGFSVADLQRMAFRSGVAVGVEEARRWIWLYIALLALLVIVPRTLLAAFSAWRRQRLGRAVGIDLREPYYVQVLARVSPARITIGLLAGDGPGRDALMRMLQQVADQAPPRDGSPWPVLATARGDVLRLFEVPPGFRPPAPAVTAQASGTSAAQAWLQDLLGRFRSLPRPQEPDGVQAVLADTDLMLLAPTTPAALQEASRVLHWVSQPAVVLVPEADEEFRAAVQRLGVAADVLPLSRTTAHWMCDPVLLDAMAAHIGNGKRAGFDRLAATWKDRNAARFGEAMRLLAGELVRAARDSEEVGTPPVRLRHLVDPAERDASQRAREGARGALLQRLRQGEADTVSALVQLHRTGTPVAPTPSARLEEGFTEQGTVDSPQAGMAGAATGAAMGAGIDLITGGLTLGAATALGAVIGGGTAYVAALWKNRGSTAGQPQVQVGDELLQNFSESLLLAYLSVAHRSLREGDAAAWRSEVVAAVEARRVELGTLWQQARSAADGTALVAPLARELEAIARG
ncbi:MAG TPA: DUF3482 domain-containing protein, partial [Ramlibacter sp.]|nr:DUF3482 domain-containing protein [Ramlibacter sp.]